MASITLSSVSRIVGKAVLLDNVSFDIAQGELVVVVGPSGSGKTSLIRAIAGLDAISSGSVLFDGEDVSGVAVADRDVGVVFQTNTLFPNYKVRRNLSFPLRIRSMRRDVIDKRVTAEARSLRIDHVLDRWPQELSAGHAQLAQLARAMVRVPRALLLDEPMAHLDAPTRTRLRRELRELQRGYGVTTLYATNDPVEAMAMADRLVVLDRGAVQQIGPPEELYARPATVHVAWLTGAVSFFEATVAVAAEGFWLDCAGFRVRAWAPQLGSYAGETVRVAVRPEGIRVDPESSLRATVGAPSFDSGRYVSWIRIGGEAVLTETLDAPRDTEVGVRIDTCFVFDPNGRLIATIG